MFYLVFTSLPYLDIFHENHWPMGELRLEVTAGGPQVQLCSMQGYLHREVRLLRTMPSCALSFSKECISKDGVFPLPGLQHSPSGFVFPLCPTSISLAANLSRCLLAFPWAPPRAWLHPLSSQTSGGEGQQLSSPFPCSVCPAQT